MNLYGLSKHLFDLAVVDRVQKREKMPPQWAGLKFFNVFGPNEYHKGAMASVLCKVFDEAKSGKPVRLFKSHREGIADGDQRRDFIYVDDTVAVMRWLLATPSVSRHFQCRHRQGAQLQRHDRCDVRGDGAQAQYRIYRHAGAIRGQYQYFTESDVGNLRRAGYNSGFTPLEEAVGKYVSGYLDQPDRYR